MACKAMVKEQEPLLAGLSFRQIEEQYYFPYNCGGSNLFLREVWGIRRLMPIENGMTNTLISENASYIFYSTP
jgi:hypothetical protein